MFLTTPNLTNISFFNCTSLERIKGINLVTSSGATFKECSNLISVEGKITYSGNPNQAFYGCGKLTGLPTFDLSGVTSASEMFIYCSSLNYDQMLDILSNLNGCSGFWRTFVGCSGISYYGWDNCLFVGML